MSKEQNDPKKNKKEVKKESKLEEKFVYINETKPGEKKDVSKIPMPKEYHPTVSLKKQLTKSLLKHLGMIGGNNKDFLNLKMILKKKSTLS